MKKLIKRLGILTPIRKPPRMEGVVQNLGIKPGRKKSKLKEKFSRLRGK